LPGSVPMPIHRKNHRGEATSDDTYATQAMETAIPKGRVPELGVRPDVAYHIVRDQLMLDGNARQNLATFCQTWFDDEIHKLMDQSIDKNMIDKDEYPATADLENSCVHMLADLGIRRRLRRRSAVRRRVRARQRCSAVWRSSGAGASGSGKPAGRPIARTS
jgi:hypothetical protein